MYNNPTSNFATVFFLVVLFIGMGLLIYYTFEVTGENMQLKESVENLQADLVSLTAENAALLTANTTLAAENTALRTENTALTDEYSKMKAELEKALTENTSLKASVDAGTLPEVEAMRRENDNLKQENLRLTLLPCNGGEGNKTGLEVLQSTILPIDLKFWINVAAVVLVEAILLISYRFYTRRKETAALATLYAERGLSRTSRTTRMIDSRFINR
jgi:regulator of replication initiation timing